MKKVKFAIVCVLPENIEASKDEINEWVMFNTGQYGSISRNNPLCEYDLFEDSEDLEIDDYLFINH